MEGGVVSNEDEDENANTISQLCGAELSEKDKGNKG